MGVYSENHTKHIDRVFGQSAEFLMSRKVVRIGLVTIVI
jgi:hypothetical protein